jgi:hypothetical protein
MRVVAKAAALIILPLLIQAKAQDDRSLTDFESRIGIPETRVSESDSNTIGALKEKLLLAETTISALTATVAEMGNSAETSRRELEEVKQKLEAVVLASKKGDRSPLEKRLLECFQELRALQSSNESARSQLLLLHETVQVLLLTAKDTSPQSRMGVEIELRKTSELLGTSLEKPPRNLQSSLNDGIVIDTKEEISLVVVNVGKVNGVKVGMPFQVLRNGKLINSIRIIDVREKISGGVIQSLSSEKLRIERGDQLKVEALK